MKLHEACAIITEENPNFKCHNDLNLKLIFLICMISQKLNINHIPYYVEYSIRFTGKYLKLIFSMNFFNGEINFFLFSYFVSFNFKFSCYLNLFLH